MLKPILALMLSLTLIFILTACGSESEPQDADNVSVSSADSSVSTEEGSEASVESVVDNSMVGSTASSEEPFFKSEIKSEPVSESESQIEPVTSVETVAPSSSGKDEKNTIASSETSSSNAVYYEMPPDDFYGNSVDELLAYLRNRQSTLSGAQTMQATSQASRKLLVPKSVRDGLIGGSIVITKDSNACVYDFQTNESEINNENEHYSVRVAPLTTEEAQKDLTELYYPGKTKSKGTYKGIDYAYQDGYEGTSQLDRSFASAWFIKDGCIIKITATWKNSFEPWNTAWFDYFDFETITF